MVVEDDDFQRKIVIRMLKSIGVGSIKEASNGREALDQINEQGEAQVDIILCDLNMPEMDGLEFLRHLGQMHSNIAIIIASAQGNQLLLAAGKLTMMYGMKLLGVVEKPVMLAHLIKLISKYKRSPNKWPEFGHTRKFDMDEISRGIRAKEFEPFFQPKVDLQTHQLVGAEALARWRHPKYGVIGPGAFIPALEKSSSIDELTFLMLEKSAVAVRSLRKAGHTIPVSVNLSLVSLDDPGLSDKITRMVYDAGIDPHSIILEITESAAMTNVAHALENLARLRMKGFMLSIDDYGTGYSSLQQLTRIPFNELKIDQSFIKDLSDDDGMRIVVESSIDMAHKLQIKSVAEGVETHNDWNTLKDLGCNTAQGYFIAKPLDMVSFFDFCAKKVPVSAG